VDYEKASKTIAIAFFGATALTPIVHLVIKIRYKKAKEILYTFLGVDLCQYEVIVMC
jgi:hypothetical protein